MLNVIRKLGNSNPSISTTIQRFQSSNATAAYANNYYISDQFGRNECSQHTKTDVVFRTQK